MKALPATLISCCSGWIFATLIVNFLSPPNRPFDFISLKNAIFQILFLTSITGIVMLPGFIVLGLFAFFLPIRSPLWQPFVFALIGAISGLFVMYSWWVIMVEHALHFPPFSGLGTWIFGGISGVSAGVVFFIAALLRRKQIERGVAVRH